MLITWGQLKEVVTDEVKGRRHTPVPDARLQAIEGPLNDTLAEFGIDTNYRIAAFLGNAILESDHLKTFEEYASGRGYEPGTEAGRRVGNTQPGDGPRFKGRGLIQVTGRTNYTACGAYFGVNLIPPRGTPTLLATDPRLAVRSAGWYWSVYKTPGLNTFADQGPTGFAETVHRVNGAVTANRTHWPERVKFYRRLLGVLGDEVPAEVPSAHAQFHPAHRRKRRRARAAR